MRITTSVPAIAIRQEGKEGRKGENCLPVREAPSRMRKGTLTLGGCVERHCSPSWGIPQWFSTLWLQHRAQLQYTNHIHVTGFSKKSFAHLWLMLSPLNSPSFFPPFPPSNYLRVKNLERFLPQSLHHKAHLLSFFYDLSSLSPFKLISLKTYLTRYLVTMVIRRQYYR